MIMVEFVVDNAILISIIMIAIGFGVFSWDFISFNFMKPKYKLDENGFVMYYYPEFNYWSYVCGWDDNDSKRTVTIHDTIRGIIFDYEYDGPGRYKFKMSKDELKTLPYKTCRELHREQTKLIDKEDALLKKILTF